MRRPRPTSVCGPSLRRTTLTRIATLTGATTGDQVGFAGASGDGVVVLPSGSYLVKSSGWDNGAATNAGALTYCDGTTGCDGVFRRHNSLVGSTASDGVGAFVTVLGTGNLVVNSPIRDNPLGPARRCRRPHLLLRHFERLHRPGHRHELAGRLQRRRSGRLVRQNALEWPLCRRDAHLG
ncbi:MAG: hypothetical protein IPK00_10155 [Deltaproteobacteria bacterium]|nr:hypothetical protein [Deltaproteobacteria bacterium]